jgi:hypothetical protein
MYTIIIDQNKNLNTAIRTTLLRNSTTDEIQFLWKPTSLIETISDTTQENPQVTVENAYVALLHYDIKGVEKTQPLITDEELYKERARFILPRSSSFFSNRGMIEVWVEITVDTKITTKVYDEETGEVIDETTETKTETFTTLPTTLFIEEVPRSGHCPRDNDNTIRITRGDSLTVSVTLTDDEGYEYEPVEGDEILFTVKKSAKSDNILIQKQVDIETLVLELVEADTKDLAFGEYKYEIEVIAGDDHYTVIKNAPFVVTEELH